MVKSQKGCFLNKDEAEIGDVAEDHFSALCSYARITSTPSRRDRFAWDHLLEYSKAPIAAVALDMEETYFSCNVQVKGFIGSFSNYKGSDISLSNIKIMIENDRPQFFAFVSVDSDEKDTYLVHLGDDIIRDGLKRIRKAEVEKGREVKLNKQTLCINPHTRNAVKVNGSNLIDYLNGQIGSSLAEYSKSKFDKRKKIGYEKGKLQITFSANPEDLLDIELGLKSKAMAKISSISDMRFNLPLLIDDNVQTVELVSNYKFPSDEVGINKENECVELELYNQKDDIKTTLNGAIKISSLSKEYKKCAIDTEFFTIVFSEKDTQVNLKLNSMTSTPQSFFTLEKMFKAYELLLCENGVEVGLYTSSNSYTLSIKALKHSAIKSIKRDLQFLSNLKWLLLYLGADTYEPIIFQVYLENRKNVEDQIQFLKQHEELSYKLEVSTSLKLTGTICVITPIEISTTFGNYIVIHKLIGELIQGDDCYYINEYVSSVIRFEKVRKQTLKKLKDRLKNMSTIQKKDSDVYISTNALGKNLAEGLESIDF